MGLCTAFVIPFRRSLKQKAFTPFGRQRSLPFCFLMKKMKGLLPLVVIPVWDCFNKNNCRASPLSFFFSHKCTSKLGMGLFPSVMIPLRRSLKQKALVHSVHLRSLPFCFLMKINFQRIQKDKALLLRNKAFCFAEREGFEPPVPKGTTVFKTAAFDHSAISPGTQKYKFFSRSILYSVKIIYVMR